MVAPHISKRCSEPEANLGRSAVDGVNFSLRLCLCRVWTCLVSQQLSVTFSAAYWFPTSHPLLLGRRLKRSPGGGDGSVQLKAHPGALLQGLSCGTWSARILWKHITSLTALGEDKAFVCSHPMLVFQERF